MIHFYFFTKTTADSHKEAMVPWRDIPAAYCSPSVKGRSVNGSKGIMDLHLGGEQDTPCACTN